MAQQEEAFFDFPYSRADPLTKVHDGIHMMPLRLRLLGAWQAGAGVVWWSLGEKLHGNALRKIILREWGTWESNPGPNALPANALTN